MPIGFASCSDDDDDSVGSSSDLIGTWESVSFTYQDKENGVVVDEGSYNTTDSRLVFNQDGTCKSAEYYNNKWNWNEIGTWSYKNGIITIRSTEDGEVYVESATVKELTSSKLVLEFSEKYTENGTSYEDYSLTEFRKISE